MAALPYMPLYVADYLADTAHLSVIEHGAYLLLIMNYWQRGNSLPANDLQLSRIARMSPKDWLKVRVNLEGFFEEIEGQWVHNRIEQELEKVRAKSKQASNAGKASVQQRSNARSTHVERPLNHTDTDTDTRTLSGSLSGGEVEPKAPPRRPSVSRATAMPDDFKPLPNVIIDAQNRGLTEAEIADEFDAMRAWAANAGTRGLKKDWNGFARTWLRKRASEKKERNNGNGQHRQNAPGSIASSFATIRSALDGEEAAIREEEKRHRTGGADADELPGLRQGDTPLLGGNR